MMDDAKGLSEVPNNIIVNVMKTIFGLDDVADVLRQAYCSSIEVIIDPIERYMVETLTIDTFCNVAECAWDYYTESMYLQKACGAFLNHNWMEITHSAEFLSLNSEIIKHVMIEANHVVFDQM
uniref:F-box domain-containing protein n=1 Tax=Panagrellus redivivus TaxID=6233 RepID=A0A7E4WD38_PANRE